MYRGECVKEKCSEEVVILCRVFHIFLQGREKESVILDGDFLCVDEMYEITAV
jgi:hypothetical protein